MSENKNIRGLLNKNRGFTTPNTINNIAELEKKLSNTSPAPSKYAVSENLESVENAENFDDVIDLANIENIENIESKNDFVPQEHSDVPTTNARASVVSGSTVKPTSEMPKSSIDKSSQSRADKLDGNTTITLAFRKEHKKILQEHFESEGIINYSTGIRSVLLKYMKAKKLI